MNVFLPEIIKRKINNQNKTYKRYNEFLLLTI